MLKELEKLGKINSSSDLTEISSFIYKLERQTTKKDVVSAFLFTLSSLIGAKFSSFVEKEENNLKIVCQLGEHTLSQKIQNIFDKEISSRLYDWILSKKQLASLKLADKENFIFLPLMDQDSDKLFEHGMAVFYLPEKSTEINNALNTMLNILGKVTSLYLSKFVKKTDSEKYLKLKEEISAELKLTSKLHKALSGSDVSKKISFSVLEDEESGFNGDVLWIGDLGADINLILIAHVESCNGLPAAMLGGYLLGEMNSLKSKAEISLSPKEVLKYLNAGLTSVFKNTAITVNAWYGVFNVGARKVRFANANHPDPFLIGPEQQVSNLVVTVGEKGKSLGISQDSIYSETTTQISCGSKLIICTQDLLEQASKVGERYDPSWLPQVLETLGTLPLSEMRNSLASILSENKNGTAQKPSRLALLLEISS